MNERKGVVSIFAFLSGSAVMLCAAAVAGVHTQACEGAADARIQSILFFFTGLSIAPLILCFIAKRGLCLQTGLSALFILFLQQSGICSRFYANGLSVPWFLLNGLFAGIPCASSVSAKGKKAFYASALGFAGMWVLLHRFPAISPAVMLSFLFPLLTGTSLFFREKWYWKIASVPLLLLTICGIFAEIPDAVPGGEDPRTEEEHQLVAAILFAEADSVQPEILLLPEQPHSQLSGLEKLYLPVTADKGKKYDLIILAPAHPCSQENERMLSKYELKKLKNRLAPGGMICVDLPALPGVKANSRIRLYGKIFAALKETFSNTVVFSPPLSLLFASDSAKLTGNFKELAQRAEKMSSAVSGFPVETGVLDVMLPMIRDNTFCEEVEQASRTPVKNTFRDVLLQSGQLPLVTIPRFVRELQCYAIFITAGLLLIVFLLRYLSAYRQRFRLGFDSFFAGWRMTALPVFTLFLSGCALSDPLMILVFTASGAVFSYLFRRIPEKFLAGGMVLLVPLLILFRQEMWAVSSMLFLSGVFAGALIPGNERRPYPFLFAAGSCFSILIPGLLFLPENLWERGAAIVLLLILT